MAGKHGVRERIKTWVTIGTRLALTGGLRVIKAALDDWWSLPRWTMEAVRPASRTDGLIALPISDHRLDLARPRWPPGRGRNMR